MTVAIEDGVPLATWWAGRESNRICSFGRYRVVRHTTRPSGTRAGIPTRIS